jgi:hypothetical protein
MQRIITTSLAILAVLALLAAPGCDEAYHMDCEAACERTTACQAQPGDPADCIARCEALDGILDEGARNALGDCVNPDCSAYAACTQDAMKHCGGDDSAFRRRICDKAVECEASSLEACLEQAFAGDDGMDLLRCLNGATLDAIADCIQQAPCETLTDAFETCLDDVLGMLIDSD